MTLGFRRRLVLGGLSLVAVFIFGTVGYYLLGQGRWPLGDCLYMTLITVTTVGYGEMLSGFEQVEYARGFTVVLILLGMGVVLYFASTFTAFIIEGDLRRALQSSRMRNRVARLKNHIIVCGVGATGRHVAKELLSTKTPMVAIDSNVERLEELSKEFGESFLYIVGDATDDHVLADARLADAAGLVAALANDKDNLYLVFSARQMHPDRDAFRIVARGIELGVLEKLEKAGANAAVSPNYIGGMRLASEMLRPAVVKFLDDMLRESKTTRIEEVAIRPRSKLAGRSVRQLDLRRKARVSVLAVKEPDGQGYLYNPKADLVLEVGMILVVLGTNEDVAVLREAATE